MKKRDIITTSALSVAVLTLALGFAINAYAADSSALKTGLRFGHRENSSNLSAEQKTNFETKRVEMEKERAVRQAAMQTAINSGSYDVWVKMVKEQMGEDAPILTKVNSGNFSQFVEAHKLMVQAKEKFQAIGLDDGEMMGHGLNRGQHNGRHLNQASAVVK